MSGFARHQTNGSHRTKRTLWTHAIAVLSAQANAQQVVYQSQGTVGAAAKERRVEPAAPGPCSRRATTRRSRPHPPRLPPRRRRQPGPRRAPVPRGAACGAVVGETWAVTPAQAPLGAAAARGQIGARMPRPCSRASSNSRRRHRANRPTGPGARGLPRRARLHRQVSRCRSVAGVDASGDPHGDVDRRLSDEHWRKGQCRWTGATACIVTRVTCGPLNVSASRCDACVEFADRPGGNADLSCQVQHRDGSNSSGPCNWPAQR